MEIVDEIEVLRKALLVLGAHYAELVAEVLTEAAGGTTVMDLVDLVSEHAVARDCWSDDHQTLFDTAAARYAYPTRGP